MGRRLFDMVDQLFPDLPEQREGPITVDGHSIIICPKCGAIGAIGGGGTRDQTDDDYCTECNGGGVVLVRA